MGSVLFTKQKGTPVSSDNERRSNEKRGRGRMTVPLHLRRKRIQKGVTGGGTQNMDEDAPVMS